MTLIRRCTWAVAAVTMLVVVAACGPSEAGDATGGQAATSPAVATASPAAPTAAAASSRPAGELPAAASRDAGDAPSVIHGPQVLASPGTPPGLAQPAVGPGLHLVSVNAAGELANQRVLGPALSGDGRFVAFSTEATNLHPDDFNIAEDVFVFDRVTGAIDHVSVNVHGVQGDLFSFPPSISADGRFVAFESGASNLIPDDTNGIQDVFVFDRMLRAITRASVGTDGRELELGGGSPAISANGRYIAFESTQGSIPEEGRDCDIAVYDQLDHTLVCASEDNGGNRAFGWAPSISGDGRYVAFVSAASHLVADKTHEVADIFVRDVMAGFTERVSLASDGAEANARSDKPVISANGRFVAFISDASNLVADDTNDMSDVFVHDRAIGETSLVSVTASGDQANNPSGFDGAAISGDGRYVLFDSQATNLAPRGVTDDPDLGYPAIYLADRQTGEIVRINVNRCRRGTDRGRDLCGAEPRWPGRSV